MRINIVTYIMFVMTPSKKTWSVKENDLYRYIKLNNRGSWSMEKLRRGGPRSRRRQVTRKITHYDQSPHHSIFQLFHCLMTTFCNKRMYRKISFTSRRFLLSSVCVGASIFDLTVWSRAGPWPHVPLPPEIFPFRITKKEEGKIWNSCLTFSFWRKFNETKNYSTCWTGIAQTNLGQVTKNVSIFNLKVLTKLSEIWSKNTGYRIRIRNTGTG